MAQLSGCKAAARRARGLVVSAAAGTFSPPDAGTGPLQGLLAVATNTIVSATMDAVLNLPTHMVRLPWSPDDSTPIVRQVRRQPTLHFLRRHAFALGVGLDLIARDHIDGEVAGFGMREVEAAHRRRRPHGEAVRQFDAGLALHI